MLGKLLKYDLKYGNRIFIAIHGFLLIACILGRFLFFERLDFNADSAIIAPYVALAASLYILLFTAVSLGVAALLAVRFYKNLFSNEGYLSWTLPATPVQQLWAKLFSGTILYIIDILLMALSLLILLTGPNVIAAYEKAAPEITQALGMPLDRYGFLVLAFTLLSSFSGTVTIYVCITIGQLFPSHRVLCAILTYFIITAVTQVAVLVFLILFNLFPGAYMNAAAAESNMTQYLFTTFKLTGGINLALTVLEYLATHYIFTKKLNLT